MADIKKFASVPAKFLASDFADTQYTGLKVTEILNWNKEPLTAADFNTDYVPATLINDARTKVEFVTVDPATIANGTTTGMTLLQRGLKYFAEGNTTDLDEVAEYKLDWTAGESKILLGTNPPLLYASFPNRFNDETIVGNWTIEGDWIVEAGSDWTISGAWTFDTTSPVIPDVTAGDLTLAMNVQSYFDITDGLGGAGDLLSWFGGVRTLINPGTAGFVLTSNGAGALPTYQAGGGGGSTTFVALTDTPGSYAASALDLVRVNAGATALEFVTPSGVPIPVSDEGVVLTAGVASFDFVGAGVTATTVGSNVTVTIPGGGGGAGSGDLLGTTWGYVPPLDTAENIVSTFTIPGNTLDTDGGFRLELQSNYNHSGAGSSPVTYRVKIGGVTEATYTVSSIGASGDAQIFELFMFNDGATNVQNGTYKGYNAPNSSPNLSMPVQNAFVGTLDKLHS